MAITNLGNVAVKPRGDWSDATTYYKNDLVGYNGSSYIAKVTSTAGTLPTNTTYWMLSAVKGGTMLESEIDTKIEEAIGGVNLQLANTKKQMKNYVLRQGRMLEPFNNTTGWSGSATLAYDAEHVKLDKSIKMTTTAALAGMTKTVSWNFLGSNFKFRLWVYVHQAVEKYDSITLLMSSRADLESTAEIPLLDKIKEGWNLIDLDAQDDWTLTGGELWTNTMVRIRILAGSADASEVSLTFGGLWVDADNAPRIVLVFDDGEPTVYQNAFPVMEQYGLTGVSYVNGSLIGDEWHMTVEQLQELQTAGWDIGNHTYSHLNLIGKTVAEIQEDIQDNIDWLQTNGFNAALHFALPGGTYNADVATAIQNCGLLTTRSSYPYSFVVPGWEPSCLPSIMVANTSTLATVIARVDKALRKGHTLILMFHMITESAATENEWSVANFTALCAYLAGREAPVVTISEWYRGLNL
jgi:peptidoglycan/xylan/chitin deacetylase (PgdA/CDA1 family)